jgi:hypothetical protein
MELGKGEEEEALPRAGTEARGGRLSEAEESYPEEEAYNDAHPKLDR